jgi:hypothetical protein
MSQVQTIQINRAPAPQSRADADLLAKYRNALERTAAGLWSISDQRVPAGADRQALEARLALLEQSQGRTAPQTIAARVARLFLRFPSSRLTDATAEATIAAYAQDLEPFPVWAIDQALMAAIQKGGAFAPSSPELRKACERAVAVSRAEAADIKAVLSAEIYRELTPSEREKGLAMFREVIAELKLNEPFSGPTKRPYSHITPDEAKHALERLEADKRPLPKLSDSARRAMGLPPRDEAAA